MGGTWGPRHFWQISHTSLFSQYISRNRFSLSQFKSFISTHSTHAEFLACAISLDIALNLFSHEIFHNRVLKITTDNQALA